MKNVLWLLPVTLILIVLLSVPAIVNATPQFELNVIGGNIIYDSAEGSGSGGADIIWIILGSVVGVIVVLLIVTFVVLPKMKKGRAGKLGNGPSGKSKLAEGSGAVQPRPAQPMQAPGMQPGQPGAFPQQQGMAIQPRPAQPMQVPGMQPGQPGAFPQQQGMAMQPRPAQPMQAPGMQPGQPGAFPQQQGMAMQPRPAQPMQVPGMQPGQPGAFPQQQGMAMQPRPAAQPMQVPGMQPGQPGAFPQQQGMAMQPRPAQPMMQPRPGYQVPQQVPVQARPVQPISPAFPQFPGMPVQGAPLFQVGNLVITPGQVKENEQVRISATVFNQGSNAGQYKLVLRVNSTIEGISELTINPGMSQVATFSVARNVPGEYYVEADNLKGTFRVTPRSPAAFSISNLTVNPEKVKQGEATAISFIVTNSGDSPGYYTAVLKIKGIDEIIEDIPVEPNSSQMVTFNVIKDAAGFFPISIEDLAARFVVEMDWKI